MTVLPNALPGGDLRRLYLHWTAGDYATLFPAYHVCVALDPAGRPAVRLTHDLAANMRDVREPGPPYAAHTAGRNSWAIGLAICGMRDAVPADFGAFPLLDGMLAAGCAAAARLCEFYGITVDAAHVMTHAEAAAQDGYFGSGAEQRWDIARFAASAEPLRLAEAAAAGDVLRARIRGS